MPKKTIKLAPGEQRELFQNSALGATITINVRRLTNAETEPQELEVEWQLEVMPKLSNEVLTQLTGDINE